MIDAAIQLALLAKAQKVFESEGLFLSFPLLSPVAYPPEKLSFDGAAADVPTMIEFSRLVNQIPQGPIYQPADGPYLWEIYRDLFAPGVRIATVNPTPEQTAAYEEAEKILFVMGANDFRDESEQYRAYRLRRDAWIMATEQYGASRSSAEFSADPAVKSQWQTTDEPILRAKIAAAESEWASNGFRERIDAADRAKREYERHSAARSVWDEWSESYNPLLDNLEDAAATRFFPAAPFDEEWPTFSMDAAEIRALNQAAAPELKSALLQSELDPLVEKVTFEFRSVALTRMWFRKELFSARFWDLPAGTPPLSDGGQPPSGRCSAYITAVVFARNITLWRRPAAAGQPQDRIVLHRLPIFKVRPELIRPLPTIQPLPRDTAVIDRNVFIGARANMVSRHAMTAVRPAAPLTARSSIFAAPGRTRDVSAIHLQPGRIPVSTAPPISPPAAPVASVTTKDITILAMICRGLPKCPDPDPGLRWDV